MQKSPSTAILASFATLKSLNDANKYHSSYQILAEFISYIINTQGLYSFTAVEIKNMLSEVFGFDVPEAVVRTACKKISFIKRNRNFYCVDKNAMQKNSSFEETKLEVENQNSNVTTLLVDYVKEKVGDKEVIINDLMQDFIAFLVDDQQHSSGKYTEAIGEFVLKNEDNKEVQNVLTAIREGSILYIGLNHNIREIGGLKKPLTLYLGTEVLFNIYGFNGEIYKKLTQDLFVQIKNANYGNKHQIGLRYFPETKKEIEGFFIAAEAIVNGQRMLEKDGVAMKAIVNNCKTSGDVIVKRADFFHDLKMKYGIIEDDYTDFYSEDKNVYNLESADHQDEYSKEGWRFVSHINKLRNGKWFEDNTDAEYLYVSNSYCALKASKEQVEIEKTNRVKDSFCDYIVSVDRITNILWYKLSKSFGRKDFPNNVDAVLKARTVLAACITQKISQEYKNIKELYKKGEITEEQLATRSLALAEKSIRPEELQAETIEELMDFSPESISRYEAELQFNRIKLSDYLEKNKIMKAKLAEYEEKEKQEKNRQAQKEESMQKFKGIILILFETVICCAIIVMVYKFVEIKSVIASNIINTFTLLSISFGGWRIAKRILNRYFNNNTKY